MKYSLSISDFNKSFENCIKNNNLVEAINLICNISHQIMISGTYKGKLLRLPDLDNALIQLADKLRANYKSPHPPRSDHICIASEIYRTGGHGKILNSIVEEFPTHVIFTDLFGKIIAGQTGLNQLISNRALSTSVIIGDDFLKKINNLLGLINAISPKRIWLLGHHQDVITILAALLFDNGKRAVFIHHCDHDPALGATIKFAEHLDITEELRAECDSIGLQSSFIPMFAEPSKSRAKLHGDQLVIASSGAIHKFKGSIAGIEYFSIIKTVLEHPSVKCFHHIGPVDQGFIDNFRQYIHAAGLNPEKIIFSGQVASLTEYMLNADVNVYIASYPLSGGTAVGEVQSAGIPVLFFDPNKFESPLLAISSVYASPELQWSELVHINKILSSLLIQWQFFSDRAFTTYLEKFSRQNFVNKINKIAI
jgi:hypothetical protein